MAIMLYIIIVEFFNNRRSKYENKNTSKNKGLQSKSKN